MNRSPSLLISLGQSQAIVPEAFLLEGAAFDSVHVITTQNTKVDFILSWFADCHPHVKLHITRVEDFVDLTSEHDHFNFEEVLYRWILDTRTRPKDRYICLSGGFKTMSAAMQKAAAVLGAAEVFHVLADAVYPDNNGRKQPASTVEQIGDSLKNRHFHWIRLGPESGWPQMKSVLSFDYPLDIVKEQGDVRLAKTPDQSFRTHIKHIVERSHRIAGAWERLSVLPFSCLATWSEADLTWLDSPLEPETDRDWVLKLPKIELHCHLGGFATSGDLLEEVRLAAKNPDGLPSIQSITPSSEWPVATTPIGLEKYREMGDNNGSALLHDPGCLQRQCELIYKHLIDQGVRYAEIRCSPANYANEAMGRSPWTVLSEIRAHFQRCMNENRYESSILGETSPKCHINLIIIGTRQASGDFRADISRHLALAVTAAEHWNRSKGCSVVGVDLAGFEDVTTRPHYFKHEFTGVHRCGLALTVHAGENDDSESIWSAVFELNALRLGHALSLGKSPELKRSVIERGIGVEMCPYANLQIKGYKVDKSAQDCLKTAYPLLDYLRSGMRVSVNTDNIGISAACLTDNLLLLARLCPGITRLEILQLQNNAIQSAFVLHDQRSKLTSYFSNQISPP